MFYKIHKPWTRILLFGAALMLIAAPLVAGNVYKWVDSKGELHFAEKAPEGVDATKVTTDTRKVGTVAPSSAEVQTYKEAAQAREEKEVVVEEKRLSRKEEKALRAQRCETARSRIAKLEPSPRVMFKGKDGEVRRLDDNERLEMLQKSKDVEVENCDN